MNCPECNTPMNGKDTCPSCGYRINNNSEVSNLKTSSPNKNSSAMYILIGIIIIFLAIIVHQYLKIGELKEERDENTSSSYIDDEYSKDDDTLIDDDIEEEDDEDESIHNSYDVSMFKSIDISTFTRYFSLHDNVTYFVYTGRETCSHCIDFLPSLQRSVREYYYELYYLDIDTVSNNDINTVKNMSNKLQEFGSTPIVYAIRNGEVVDNQLGYTTYANYEQFLTTNGVIKK